MTSEELTAGLEQLPEARASALPSGLALMAAFGNTIAQAQVPEQRREEDARQRRLFLAEASDLGVSDEDAERILTLAHSDDVRYGHRQTPYDFAYAVLQTVVVPGDR